MRTTSSGVDEKPHKKPRYFTLYRGFLFYSLLTEAGTTVGCKVAHGIEAAQCTISTLECTISTLALLLCNF
jgi:hypothetical protein